MITQTILDPTKKLVILGAGYLGQRTAQLALHRGYGSIVAVRRRTPILPSLRVPSVEAIALDLSSSDAPSKLRELLTRLVPKGASYDPTKIGIFYCLSPDSSAASAYDFVYKEGLKKLLKALEDTSHPDAFQVILASSTSVYQEHTGAWVDETTTDHLPPQDGTGRLIYEGEQILKASAVPWSILRFGGIYGPERLSFFNRVTQGEEPLFIGKDLYTNRIHVDDGASMVLFCLEHPSCQGEVFNGVDCEPASRNEVVSYLWRQTGRSGDALRKTENLQEIRHRGNKRCRSDKIRSLGFTFGYPTYKEGYLLSPKPGG